MTHAVLHVKGMKDFINYPVSHDGVKLTLNAYILQDLIIDAIYADIIHGKLDQKNKQVRTVKSDQYLVCPKSVTSVSLCDQTWFEK